MMKYTVIYRESGEPKPKQTVLKSDDESSLRRECEAKGWQVLHIRPANEQDRGDRFVQAFTGELHPPIRFGVSTTELCAFCENVSKLCRIGIPLPQIIDDCIQKEGNALFRKRLLIVRERLQSGDSLADAMEDPRCVKAFPLLLRRRVRFGEANGRLADSLGRFNFVLKFEKTRREVMRDILCCGLALIETIFGFFFIVMMVSPGRVIEGSQLPLFFEIGYFMRCHQVACVFALLFLIVGVGVLLWVCVKLFSTRIALWKFRRAMRKQESKKIPFTESREFILLIVALVIVVLPFGLDVIGEATGLFSFPASKWMKEAFAILTR
mgnify:CR=1 FL=1